MKKFVIAICIFIGLFACKPSHIYNDFNANNSCYRDNTFEVPVDITDYTAYYRIILRDENNLEKIYEGQEEPNSTNGAHITDIQYILINKAGDRFIQISYMPTRFVKGDDVYYLDASYPFYKQSINIYQLNMLFYGEIDSGNLKFIFYGKSQNRDIKYSIVDDKLILESINYINKDKIIDLNTTLSAPYLTYTKMDSQNFVIKKPGESPLVHLDNQIIFSKFKHCWQNTGKGKNNAIIFKYINPLEDGSTHLYFREHNDRFNFKLPELKNKRHRRADRN